MSVEPPEQPPRPSLPPHWRADIPFDGRQLWRWVAPVLVHLLSVVVYVLLNGLLVGWYKHYTGGLMSRGVSVGIALYMVFWFFAGMSLLIAVLPRVKGKLIATGVMVAVIIWFLMPGHPLRALFYSALSGGLSLLAIAVTGYLLTLTLKGSK